MKKYIGYTMIALFATLAVSTAASNEDLMQEKEKAAWQAFKDKKPDDFKKVSLILNQTETAGEPQWLRGPLGRPLEPDAGNAAEGSEGPMPDRRFQPYDFPRMDFNHEWTRIDTNDSGT